ncbi:MAG TPA: 5-methyltetrahydropteroyltriglutamate--homocysteine S-methyltransferase, partial [bacterium]|nr:5-methyltetrahydropteroyltriglutamate--homocysteine S-methyltransferase [bacterium]
ISFLLLGKTNRADFNAIELLPKLLPIYSKILRLLWAVGAEWVQIDEPCLVLDLDADTKRAYRQAYNTLRKAAPELKILLATYFGDLEDNLDLALALPIDSLHLDLVRGPGQLERALHKVHASMGLSLGLVDGRNVWRTDLDAALAKAQHAVEVLGTDRVQIAPSCSLLTSPVDLDLEPHLDPELRSWLAFAKQKLHEVAIITKAINEGPESVAKELEESRKAVATRRTSPRIHRPEVEAREAAITDADLQRTSPYPTRATIQRNRLNLPAFPTTTIGSFPQTHEIRAHRANFKAGKLDQGSYESFLKGEIEQCIRFQEEIGLDVLVHGEAERTDMVEYFGEQLEGVAITHNGWVQSYGSRCVRPPIIYGDVVRPAAMTVRWSQFAQSLTDKPVK